MKKILITSLAIIIIVLPVFLLVRPAKTEFVSYYSGDAAYYQGKVFVTSTNSDALEVFKLEGDSLKTVADILPIDERYNTYGKFYGSMFSMENGQLYVYAVSDFTLYKYQVVNTDSLTLIKKVRNNSWEWYSRVDKFGDYIVTIGPKGVKIWSQNMDIIDGYDITNYDPYNIQASNSNLFIFSIENSALNIYDRATRQIVKTISLSYKQNTGNHKMYYNPITNNIFVVDDFYAKKFNMNGELLNNFRHLDFTGFDIDSSGNNYVYFSNGMGVVKLNQSDLSLVTSATTATAGGEKGWAMGMKVVATSQGDRIVVFNNSNILVLDQSLNTVAFVKSAESNRPVIKEDLWLNLNNTVAAPNSQILLSGGGFAVNEVVKIEFANKTFQAVTDNSGRFETNISVPEVDTIRTDIKVTGQQSNLHYSIAFNIL